MREAPVDSPPPRLREGRVRPAGAAKASLRQAHPPSRSRGNRNQASVYREPLRSARRPFAGPRASIARIAGLAIGGRRPEVTNGIGVERHAVLVAGDRRAFRRLRRDGPWPQSTSIRWLSVPPTTMSAPPALTARFGRAPGIAMHHLRIGLNSGRSASPGAALAAMTCISGPPCRPGKTAELIFLAISLVVGRHHAAARAAQRLVGGRGDDVRMRHGDGCDAAGDEEPAKCAMSTIR